MLVFTLKANLTLRHVLTQNNKNEKKKKKHLKSSGVEGMPNAYLQMNSNQNSGVLMSMLDGDRAMFEVLRNMIF